MSVRDHNIKTTLLNQQKTGKFQSLPLLNETAFNLQRISTASLMQSSLTEDKLDADQWAFGIRQRIQRYVREKEDIPKEILFLLKNELIQVFIKVLQEDSGQYWTFLQDVLELLLPFKDYLDIPDWNYELQHYMKRLWTHLNKSKNKPLDVDISGNLKKIFPKVVFYIETETDSILPKSCLKKTLAAKGPPSNKSPRLSSGKNEADIFCTKITLDEKLFASSKPLTILDLHNSIGNVAYDIASYESYWGSCHGLTAQAANIHLPEEVIEVKHKEDGKKVTKEKIEESTKKPKVPKKDMGKILSGREAVEYYIKSQHLQKVEHLYFNLAPSRHFRPYHLVSVPKDKLNREYYLFSSFGVLHVDKDLHSETFRLTEWQRYAVLWEAIHEIPFFNNYLIAKMFNRWKKAKSYLQLNETKISIERTLLQAMPIYGAGLLQILKLLNELITIDFLPFNAEKSYTLLEFEDAVFKVQSVSKVYLERFFRLCKIIVNVIMFESFKKLRFCEEQMTAKNMFSRDSVFLMKMKRKQRLSNFLNAKNESSHLGNFVLLINQITMEYLFTIAKSHIQKFMKVVLRSTSRQKGYGFFKIKLVFNKEATLEFSPSIEECEDFLHKNIHGIASVLCSEAIPLGILEISKLKSNVTHQDNHDSTDAIKRYIKQFLNAHPDLIKDIPELAMNFPFKSQSQVNMEDTIFEQADIDKLDDALPKKSEDDWGVATPDNIQRHRKKFQVTGESFLGQYTPLFTSKVEEKLLNDPEYIRDVQLQSQLLYNSKSNLERYLHSLRWLEPIYQMCIGWNSEMLIKYKELEPTIIAEKLLELKTWKKEVAKVNDSHISRNQFISVYSGEIFKYLIPRLDFIYKQLLSFVLQDCKNNSVYFCKEMKKMTLALEKKPEDVKDFSGYIISFKKVEESKPKYKHLVDRSKALYEITRSNHRLLTDEEFDHENNLWIQWEVLQSLIQNTSEFISVQSPVIERKIDEMFETLQLEANQFCNEATSGKFLDPNQNPTKIVEQIKQIRLKFYDVQNKLVSFNKWRKNICGESFDLKFLHEISVQIDARSDVWKNLLHTLQTIDEWKMMSYQKMKFTNAMKKINEWKTIAAHLRSILPPDDLVIEYWEQCLNKIHEPLPLVQVISSDHHKTRHWKAIFNGMSAGYIHKKKYLISELLSLDLLKHSPMIMSIHQLAVAEYDLERRVKNMQKNWNCKMFKLLKYFPDHSRSKKALIETKGIDVKKSEYASKFTTSTDDEYYILIEVERLKTELMDDSIILATMLSSNFLGDVKMQVENLASALHQVEEIIGLWVSAQKTWMFLEKMFARPSFKKKFPELVKRFEESVHLKYKEWMRVVYADSKVLSVASKSITEKGYRYLQGEQLRKMFLSLIDSMESMVANLNFVLDENRKMFPRLFFLSDNELIEVLSISNDPHELPGVQRCFPGVDGITLTVLGTNPVSSKVASSEVAINAYRLITIGIEGKFGEKVNLIRSVGPMKGVIQWLSDFETSMKDTMVEQLTRCVVEKFKKAGIIQPESNVEDDMPSWKMFKEFPLECLRLADAITWEKQMEKCLKNKNFSAMKKLKDNIEKQISTLSNSFTPTLISTHAAFDDHSYYIHTTLISLWINLRDLTQVFINDDSISLECFEWQTAIKYHVNHRTILQAETEQELIPTFESSLDDLTRIKTTMKTIHRITDCEIHHLNAKIPYEYEYLGPSAAFVNTPLTEKAMISLTQSLKNYQCGTIIGPATVGKTETIKEFARAFGQCLFHIKCGEMVSSFQVKQYMTGLILSGCWALFDDVNRLTEDVMCTLSQYLDQVQTALRGLKSQENSQYTLRGQSKSDKKPGIPYHGRLVRRNSLTTLHSYLEKEYISEDITAPLTTQKPKDTDHYNNGLITFFVEEKITGKHNRRSSIYEIARVKDCEFSFDDAPPPLAYEQVTLLETRADKDFFQKPLYNRAYSGNIKFDGKFIQACSSYGCLMTLNSTEYKSQNIPDTFRLLLRPFSLLIPDYQQIAQVECFLLGFTLSELLAKKLVTFVKLFRVWLPRQARFQVRNLSFLKSVLLVLKKVKIENYNAKSLSAISVKDEEKYFMIEAIKEVFTPYLDEGRDKVQFQNLMEDVFGYIPKDNLENEPFHKALQDELKNNKIQLNQTMISKIVEVYKSCSQSLRNTIVCGPCGSGKTLIIKTLIQALNMLSYKAGAIERPEDEPLQPKEADILISNANDKIKSRMQLLQHIISNVRPPPNTLNQAILKKKKDYSIYPKIYATHLFPGSLRPEEFLGYYTSSGWKCGRFWQELQKSTFSDAISTHMDDKNKLDLIADTQVWIILDGSLHSSWCDPIASLFDSSRKLILPNADTFSLKDETKLIVETDQLLEASPTMMNQCSVVFCSPSCFQWQSLFSTWKNKNQHKFYMAKAGERLMDELANQLIPATLTFLQQQKGVSPALVADLSPLDCYPTIIGLQEMMSFLNLLSIFLDKAFSKDHPPSEIRCDSSRTEGSLFSEKIPFNYKPEEEIPHYMNIIKGIFIFSFIWGFGAHLHERNLIEYDQTVRKLFEKSSEIIHFPLLGTVFDYWVSENNGVFHPWIKKLKLTGNYKLHTSYVLMTETTRYKYIITLLLDNNVPVMLLGNPGVGKTAFIMNEILSSKMKRHCMSALQTPDRFQDIIMLREQGFGSGSTKNVGVAASATKREKAVASLNKNKAKQSQIIFIDDLNMAPKENGCQPILESFRQILTTRNVFDTQQHIEHNLKHLNFMTAATLPYTQGSGINQLCHVMSSRFSRLFFNIVFHTPTYDRLETIYSSCIFPWLEDLPFQLVPHPTELAKSITQGTLDMFFEIKDKLRATPNNPMYMFTLHDLACIFDGITLFSPQSGFIKMNAYKRSTKSSDSISPLTSITGSSHHEIFHTNYNEDNLPLIGTLVRLWVHECNRTFADRIRDEKDYAWYLEFLEDLTDKYFCQPTSDVCMGPSGEMEDTPKHRQKRTSLISSSGSSSFIDLGPFVNTVSDDEYNGTTHKEVKKPDSETKSKSEVSQTNLDSEQISQSTESIKTLLSVTKAKSKVDFATDGYKSTRSSSFSYSEPGRKEHGSQEVHFYSTSSLNLQKSISTLLTVQSSIHSLAKRSFFGPLMSMNEVKGSLYSLNEVMFSRYIIYSGYSVYNECSMSEMVDALKKRINKYNSSFQLKWSLTLIEDFIPLIIKLTRVLTFPYGHGLLFRTSCKPTARSALIKFAAHLANAEVIEPSVQLAEDETYDEVLENSLKQACQQAGVLGTSTVLIIPEFYVYNCNLKSISTLLSHGDSPNLFEQATQLSHLVQTALSERKPSGSSNKLTDEQMSKVFQIFFTRIKQNLHIFILLTLDESGSNHNKLNELFERYPTLVKHTCSIMIEKPLSTSAYQQFTMAWMKEEEIDTLFSNPADFGRSNLNENLIMLTVSNAMAYIHQTAQVTLLKQVLHEKKIMDYYPINYLRELVHMFKEIVMFIVQREKENISHYAGALGKVNEAYGSINDYKETLCRLSPQHKTAMDNIEFNLTDVAKKRESFKKLLSLNKEHESKIGKLQILKDKMLEIERKMFLEVEPQYQEVMRNLISVDKLSWHEIKKYRQPPEPIKKLFCAICILFEKPMSWEEGMSIMADSTFINNITFYNKKDLSDDVYYALQKYIVTSDLRQQTMGVYSRAASSVCEWVLSVYRHASIVRRNKPIRDKLNDLDTKLMKAQEILGEVRKETRYYKSTLEKNIKFCKESMKLAKNLEKQIQNMEKKVADASHLMGNISGQHKLWKKEVTYAKQNIATALGDGLLAAAYICYCGPLDDQSRKKLLDEWLEHFEEESFTDITAFKMYPKLYSKSATCKCQSHVAKKEDTDLWVTVQAYESNVEPTEFNYSSGLMKEANPERLDDSMDLDTEDQFDKVLLVRKNFQLVKVLSNYEELSEWRLKNYPVDSRSLQNACILNMCKLNSQALWPLLIDPDGQAEMWVKYFYYKNKSAGTDSLTNSTMVSPMNLSCVSSSVDLSIQNEVTPTSLSPFGLRMQQNPNLNEINRISVITAEDPMLETRVRDAINYGFLLLITHVGHQPLKPILLWLISCHKVTITEYENTHTVLKTINTTSPCHKNFFIFLATNIPLSLHGFNFHHLPLKNLNIIDLSLSNEAVMNRILYEILQVERLDFEKQRRANESEIVQHRQQLFHEFALIREKTMNLEGPLIEDKTILESLLTCQRNVERNRIILDESCSKERNLEETYAPYVPMVIEAATIYSFLKNVNQLHSCYFISFDTFIKLFKKGLQNRNREYSSVGEPKSRADELLYSATTSIFEFVSMMMFEEHLTIFYLGFTLERLLKNKMTTDLEIGIFLNGFKFDLKKFETILTGRPEWISPQVWIECFLLETMVDPFKGLIISFAQPLMHKQWQEYFKLPIILMNQVPDAKFQKLTIFQKALLWKIFSPDRFSELCHNLIVSELGKLISPPNNYNIQEIYKYSETKIPILFLLPSPVTEDKEIDGTQGFLYSDPVREVKRFAKELKMDSKVVVANCTSQMTVESLIEIVLECFDNDYWLVLQNYHMCSPDIHLQLASIMQIFLKSEELPLASVSSSMLIEGVPSETLEEEELLSESNFRLWVTFISQPTKKNLPPACLIQQSIKVTCETTRNFQSTLLKCHRAAKFLFQQYETVSYKADDNLGFNFEIMALAVIHSLLIQHRCFVFKQSEGRTALNEPCYWSMLDMASVSDIFSIWLPITNLRTLEKLADLLGGIYASHSVDAYDAGLIKGFVLDILRTMYHAKEKACSSESKNLKGSNVVNPNTKSYCSASSCSSDILVASACQSRKVSDGCYQSQFVPDLLRILFRFAERKAKGQIPASKVTTTKPTPCTSINRSSINRSSITHSSIKRSSSTSRSPSSLFCTLPNPPSTMEELVNQLYQNTNTGSFFADMCCHIYGLPFIAQQSLFQHQSRILFNKLSILSPHKSISNEKNQNLIDALQEDLTKILQQLTDEVNSLPEFPDISKKITIYRDESFLMHEINNYKQLFHLIQKQLQVINKHLHCQIELTIDMKKVMKQISNNEVPTPWFASSFASSLKLTKWIKKIVTNAKQLLSTEEFTAFKSHELTNYLRPDCLLASMLQTHAQKNLKDLTELCIAGMFNDKKSISSSIGTIILNNTHLCNAVWVGDKLDLDVYCKQDDPHYEECTCTKGILYLNIVKTPNNTNNLIYFCPVFLTQNHLNLSKKNSVIEIPLMVAGDNRLFYGKKTHLHFY